VSGRRRCCPVLAAALVAFALVIGASATARAQKQVTIGLYAPTAPFRGPSERLEYISNLAAHLDGAAPGQKVVGRVFARASAFAAAVKNGDIQFAVVDAPYAAARGLPYQVLAAATRDGDAAVPWMMVASGRVRGIGDLWGKVVAMPRIGARDRAFLAHSLLQGEVEASFFAKVSFAPDSYSALTLVSVGRAQAAFVPSGVPLPPGTTRVFDLRSVGWPMFVALPKASKRLTTAFRDRLNGFSGQVLTGFTRPEAGNYPALRASFTKRRRRGPMAMPRESRLALKGLFAGSPPRIQMSDVALLVTIPPPADGAD